MAKQNKAEVQRRRRNRRILVVVLAAVLVVAAAALAIFGLAKLLGGGENAGSLPSSRTAQTSGETSGAAPASGTAGAPATDTTKGATKTTASKGSTKAPVSPQNHYVQKNRSPWNLLLVNDWNSVPDNYLSTFTMANFNGPSKQCDSRIVEPLRAMLNAGNAANPSFKLSAASLYRTEELQAKNYNNKVAYYKQKGFDQKTAESKAATVIKRPGQSEHNTGLCADLLGAGYSSLEQSFANTEAYKWLKAHCAEYGFILRYPKEKEAVTAVIFEPWHYRYVGVEAAREIMSRGICLEEYAEEKGL